MKYSMFSKFMLGIGMMTLAVSAFAREGGGGKGHGPGHGEGMKQGRKGVEARIENQERRIKKGVEKGKLTADEAQKLQAGVDAIKEEAKASAESDGKVTKEERKALRKKLKASSEAIRNAKHPDQPKPAEGGEAPAAPAEGEPKAE